MKRPFDTAPRLAFMCEELVGVEFAFARKTGIGPIEVFILVSEEHSPTLVMASAREVVEQEKRPAWSVLVTCVERTGN